MCSILNFCEHLGDELERVVARVFEAAERLVLLHDLRHLGFDLREVFFADRGRRENVVVEPVLGGRTEGQLHAGEEPHNRARPSRGY